MKPLDIDFRMVVDSTPAFIFSARPDGYIDYVNQRWLERVGAPLDLIEGWEWTNFIHPADREEHVRRWRTSMASGEPAISEARFRCANGEYRWMLHHTVPLRNDRGQIVRWFGSSVDIDDRKRAERELHDLKEQLHKENIALRDEIGQTSMFEEIVGSSAPLRRVLVLVAKVASADTSVLITGETGTGKELIARAIHKRSPRASGPFVCVNCGAIPPSLISSELRPRERRSPVPSSATSGASSWPREEPSFSTRQASCLRKHRSRSSVFCRNEPSNALVAASRSRLTFASSPRQIAISARLSRMIRSAAISTTGSASFRFTSRRCASAPKTFHCSSSI
jgi:PAS domain S-box-containing protein